VPKCQHCGLELAPEDRFCRRCGAKVGGRAPSATLEAMAAEYRKVVEDHPDDPDARFSLGLALLYNERWAEAEEHLRRVTELAPDFGDAYARLVVCLAKLGRLEEAEAVAARGLARAPDNPELPRLREQLERLRSQGR